MENIPHDIRPLVQEFIIWAKDITARQHALEALVVEKLGITAEQWNAALSQANESVSFGYKADEHSDQLATFLQGLTRHP